MALGSVHSGSSITEGKARMETNETFETLFPRILPSRPEGNFAGSLRRRSRGVPGLQSAFLGWGLVAKIADRRGGGLRRPWLQMILPNGRGWAGDGGQSRHVGGCVGKLPGGAHCAHHRWADVFCARRPGGDDVYGDG